MTNTVEIDDEAKPALVADTLALFIGRPEWGSRNVEF